MSQNALLRSVKGLGIPGTARKEDRKKTKLKVASPAPEHDHQIDDHQTDDRQTNDRQIDDRQTNDRQTNDRQINDRQINGRLNGNDDDRKDHFAMRNGVRCAGVHLIVDLHGAKRLNDIDHIEATLRRCVEAASATLLHIHLHHFQPSGVSGVAVLAESHISIHTWPESGYAALDVFMCGSAEPEKCIPVLREAFAAEHVGVNELLRGKRA